MKKNNNFIIIITFIILIFSEILSKFFFAFSYLDEILAVIALLRIILSKKAKDLNKIFHLILLLLIIGFVSNYFSGLKTNVFAIMVDAFTTFKAFFIYIGFNDLLKSENSDKIIKKISIFSKFFLLAAFIFCILNYLSLVNMTEYIRYGIKEYKFIFINAGSFGYYLMAILPFLEKNKKNNYWLFLTLFLILSTLKGPQIIFVFLYVYYSFLRKIKDFKKIGFLLFPFVLISILYLSRYQIDNYLKNQSSARYILTEKAIVTANDFFPLGSGFATYGSEMSKRYYSPLYNRYQFNLIYGLGGESIAYLNDNYWQMIVAQLGYMGLILNIILMIKFCKNILKKMKYSSYYIWTKCMIFCVMIGSLGSAYITGCAFSTIMLAACIINGDVKNETK